MDKKLISLLVAICLVIGLLPVASIAAEGETATAKIAFMKDFDFVAEEGGTPVYGKTVSYDAYTQAGAAAGTGWKFVTEGATENDWNVMFAYPRGGQPTLTLKDANIDMLNNSGNPLYYKNEQDQLTKVTTSVAMVLPKNGFKIDLKIVLQGTNVVETDYGIVRAASSSSTKFNSVTIVGETGSSLTGTGKALGFQGRYGVPITIQNANITLSSNSTNANSAPIYTEDANITIEDSTLNFTCLKGTVNAIHAEGSGNISITNSNLELTATGTAFNKTPNLSAGFTAKAGDDAANAGDVTDAAALATAKYVKVEYPATQPSSEPSVPSSEPSVPSSEPSEPSSEPSEPSSEPSEPSITPSAPSAGDELATKPSIRIGFNNYPLTHYDKPVYLVNESRDAKDTEGNAFTAWGSTGTGANEENYNLKYFWKTGDAAPTLILRGFKFDEWNNESSKLIGKVVGGAYTSTAVQAYPLTLPTNAPTNIVLTGADSLIEGQFGLVFKNNTTITSEGNTKLVMDCRTGCITSNETAGAALTIDANLDLSIASFYNTAFGAGVIHTYKADLTINGGDIICRNNSDRATAGIYARAGGDVIINGGNITAHGIQGQSATSGTVQASSGNVIVTGGTLNVTAKASMGIYAAQNVEISGGTVNITDNIYYGIRGSAISITGGTVEITTTYRAFYVVPALGSGITGVAGANAGSVEAYTDAKYQSKYVKIGVGVEAPSAPSTPSSSTPQGSTPSASTPSTPSAPSEPPVYGDELATKPSIAMSFTKYKLTHYDKPIYLVNSSSTTEDTDGQKFTKWVPTTTGANESNYNAKFVWNVGEANPTLILRGLKYDVFNNETGKLESKMSGTEYTGSATQIYPLILPSDVPMTIILTGEDSLLESQFGITYYNDLFIKSEDDAKLVITSQTGCIGSNSTAGAELTIDANLDLSSLGYYNSAFGAGVIHTYKADLTINGGTIVCKNTASTSVAGITARGGGNVIFNSGNVTAHGVAGASTTTGAVMAPAGKVIFNGGNVDISAAANLGVYALNAIEFKGSTVRMNTAYYGANAGNKDTDGTIEITGGSVEIVSQNGGFYERPALGAGIAGYAGDSVKYAKAYDPAGNDFKMSYVKIGLNITAPDASNLPTMPGMDPSAPGIDPGAPEIEPTADPNAKTGDKLKKNVSVEVGGVKLTISKYGTAAYTANSEKEVLDTGGNKFKATVQTVTSDEKNWNSKLVWHANEAIPTLYINGLVIDEYNEDKEAWMRRYQVITETDPDKAAEKAKEIAYTTAIKIPAGQYMKVVITGKDSSVKCRFGIVYKSKLLLKSDDKTKLDIWNFSGAVTSEGAKYIPLVVDANLNLNVQAYYNTVNSHVLQTCNADLTINGGTINIDSNAPKSIVGIFTQGSGNIIINGGTVNVNSPVGTSPDQGSIKSIEKIIINGGTVNATAKVSMPIYAKRGIEINGGVVNLTSTYYGINSGGEILINGGTTTIVGQYACYKAPIVKAGLYAYAGAGPKSAEIYDGSDTKMAKRPWMMITDDESKKIEPEEFDDTVVEDPNAGTEAPTTPGAPDATETTAAPNATGATTPSATTPKDDTPEDETISEEEYYNITPNLNIISGISDDIPDALYEMGIDSADMIRDILVENIWYVDEIAEYFAFFDIKLMYHDGEDWVEADEEHFPEDGFITALLPYPVGTDKNTEFTAVHMFTSDAFGMTPGEVELVYTENIESGIIVELTGLSPVALAWYANPATGDTGIGLYVGLMVVAVLGMAATVVLSKKKRKA